MWSEVVAAMVWKAVGQQLGQTCVSWLESSTNIGIVKTEEYTECGKKKTGVYSANNSKSSPKLAGQ